MRSAYALRSGVAASLVLAVAACLSAPEDPSPWTSAVKKSDPCLAAAPVDLGAGVATIVGDSRGVPARPEACGGSAAPIFRPSYYSFTVSVYSALYVDTLGSSFDTIVGLLAGGCGAAPASCWDDGCGSAQTQLVVLLEPNTYHLAVGGKAAEDRGPFTARVQLVPVPGPPAGEIPRGDFTLEGVLGVGGNTLATCGPALASSWWWYASCPGEAGPFWADTATVFSKGHAALWWLDVDDGEQVCDPPSGTGLVPPYHVEATDESEGGLHVLEIRVVNVAMGVPVGEPYVVTGHRP